MNNAEPHVHPAVDLVIVMHTSASMQDEAEALSHAAAAAIAVAQTRCPADLRVVWLGMEGTWRGTNFSRTLRQYLTQECAVPESALRGRKHGEVPGGGAHEDAARAMEDIARHFSWRPEAKRAIFYLGDEALRGGSSAAEQQDIEAAKSAIQVAKDAGVIVHTYLGTTRSPHQAALQQEYARMAQETDGHAFTEHDARNGFAEVLEKAICTTRNREEAALATPMPAEGTGDPGEAGEERPAPPVRSDIEPAEMSAPVQAVEPAPHGQSAGKPIPAQVEARHREALALVKRYVIGAIAVGTLPLPVLDFAALLTLKIRMVMQLSRLYGIPFRDNRDRAILLSLVVPLIPSLTRHWVLSLVKLTPVAGYVVGAVAMSSVAGTIIYAVGRAFMHHFEQGHSFLTFRLEDIKRDVRTFLGEGEHVVSELRQSAS